MPPTDSSESFRRREFLRSTLRYAALAGVSGVVATAVARKAPWNGPGCSGSGFCEGCSLLVGCGEARAADARQDQRRREEAR